MTLQRQSANFCSGSSTLVLTIVCTGVRKKCNPKNYTRRTYGNISDYILFYTKSNNYVWNRPLQAWTEEAARKSLCGRGNRTQVQKKFLFMPLESVTVRLENPGVACCRHLVNTGNFPHRLLMRWMHEGKSIGHQVEIRAEKYTWTKARVYQFKIYG